MVVKERERVVVDTSPSFVPHPCLFRYFPMRRRSSDQSRAGGSLHMAEGPASYSGAPRSCSGRRSQAFSFLALFLVQYSCADEKNLDLTLS